MNRTYAQRTRCQEQPGYRACVACERPMTVNVRYAFPDRHTVLCLCWQCEALGFALLPCGQVVRELDALELAA